MPDSIVDGTGTKYEAKVDSSNRLRTRAITISNQNYASRVNKDAFQVSAFRSITTSDTPVLYLENATNDKYIVITFIRVATAGAAATNENAYFTINLGGRYSSGGTAIKPVNMFAGLSVSALATAYSAETVPIVMAGTPLEIDRQYEANHMEAYNKEGSIILQNKAAISVNHIGSSVAGAAYARISFYYIDKGDP